MKTYIMLSGSNNNKAFYETSERALKKGIKETSSIVFIASRWHTHEKNDGDYKRINQWLKDIDIHFTDVYLIDSRMINEKQVEILKESSCIFLMGGDTLALRKSLRINHLDEVLLQYERPIIGISAGAINMAKRSVLPLTRMRKRSYVYRGIGLVDVSVTPHFDLTRTKHIEDEIFPMSYDGKIYGLEENGTILLIDGSLEFFGTIYEISNGLIQCVHKE